MNERMKERIILKSREIGINKIGFTHGEPFYALESRLYQQRASGYHSGFEHQKIEERIYPAKIFENPQSIISIALAYPSRPKEKPKYSSDNIRGVFARASWGRDYHYILEEKMNQLIEFIKEIAPEFGIKNPRFKSMVDTGELVDVAVAARAGLGFIGRNGLLVTKEFGSYLYLGEIITNIPFLPDSPVDYDCGDCYRCVDACPTGALLGDSRINAKVCLSYQTQTKSYMPDEFRSKMGRTIYGCDICQIVCPYNRGMDVHDHSEMEPDIELIFPPLHSLISISNREFKERFSYMAGSWRGKKPLQRNSIIALANGKDFSAVPHLIKVIETDSRPIIRGTAAWALGTILETSNNIVLVEFLEEALEREEDPETIAEFNKGIQLIKS